MYGLLDVFGFRLGASRGGRRISAHNMTHADFDPAQEGRRHLQWKGYAPIPHHLRSHKSDNLFSMRHTD